MSREFKPMSRLLRSAFLVCAATITVAVGAFIELLASERGVSSADAARAASVIVARR